MDADSRNVFNIGKHVSRKLKVKPDEPYEVFEYTPSDEEMPSEVYDDFADFPEDLEPV